MLVYLYSSLGRLMTSLFCCPRHRGEKMWFLNSTLTKTNIFIFKIPAVIPVQNIGALVISIGLLN